MRIIKSIRQTQQALERCRQRGQTIGFVPTMGALHAGHASLLKKARRENDIVALSIFVNPKQFTAHEDLRAYPRQKTKDILLAKKEKVDIIFYPSEKTMYPRSFLTNVYVSELDQFLCGQYRKGHFQGVTTVVLKLLHIAKPHRLYLGQKDAQQAIIITRMIQDLDMETQVRICATIREKSGLALSSRNSYLSNEERKEASSIYRSLKQARGLIKAGERSPEKIQKAIKNSITQNSRARIQYIQSVDYKTLKPVKRLKGKTLIAVAAFFKKARLIDNIVVQAP